MHEILQAIHRVAPIRGIKVTRESWKTHNGKGKNEVVHVQIKRSTLEHKIIPLIMKQLRKPRWKTSEDALVLPEGTATKGDKTYSISFHGPDGIKIEPPGQRVSKLQELRVMRAVKMHH